MLYCSLQDIPFPYSKAGEEITLSSRNKVGVLKKHSLVFYPQLGFLFVDTHYYPKGPIYSDFDSGFAKDTSQRPSQIKFLDLKLEIHIG